MTSSWPAFTLREAAARQLAAPLASTYSPPPPAPARARRRRGQRQQQQQQQQQLEAGGGGQNHKRSAKTSTIATANADEQAPTVETYSAKRDERIVVTSPGAGFLFDLRLSARIPHPPERVFEVLADEEAHKIFRGLKETVSRDVLSDDGRGNRSLLVAHRAGLRVMGLSASFETRLRVDEDRRQGVIRFRGADADDASGGGGDAFMRRFEGAWTVRPFNERALSLAYGGGGGGGDGGAGEGGIMGSLMERLGLGSGGGFFGGGDKAAATTTLVTLEQAIAPRLTPPRPFQPLVRALCGRTLQLMVEDLKVELDRRERARRRAAEDASVAVVA